MRDLPAPTPRVDPSADPAQVWSLFARGDCFIERGIVWRHRGPKGLRTAYCVAREVVVDTVAKSVLKGRFADRLHECVRVLRAFQRGGVSLR
jgi:hypothetical protein